MGEEGALSLLGDTAVKGAGKLIDVGYEPTKKVLAKGAQIADKITEAIPAMSVAKKTIKGLPTANVDGAQASIKAMVGNEAEQIAKNAQKLGGYEIDNNNLTDIALLNKPINFIKDYLGKNAEKLKLDKLSEFLNNTKGLNEKQKEILDLSLADTKTLPNVLHALQTDKSGASASALADLAHNDVGALRQLVNKRGHLENGELSKNVSDYFSRVGREFEEMENELAKQLNGKTTSLNSENIALAKEQMAKNMSEFDKSSPEAQYLFNVLDRYANVPMSFEEIRKFKKDFNEEAQKIFNKNASSYFTKIDTSAVGKIIDDAVFSMLENPMQKAYYKENLSKYHNMKGFKENELFSKMLDPNSSGADVVSMIMRANNSQGEILDKFVKELSEDEARKFEGDLLAEILNSQIGKFGEFNPKEILDGIGLKEILNQFKFHSKEANEIKEAMISLARARGTMAELFGALEQRFILPTLARAGIATTLKGASKTMVVNQVRQKVFKYIGKIGDDAALEYHIQQALKSLKVGKSLKEVADELKSKGVSEKIADGISESIRQTALQRAEKGASFSTKEGKLTYLDNVKFELDDILKKQTGIDEAINASLSWLKSKHPEMFKSRRAVKELIDYVIESPNNIKDAKTKNSVYLGKNHGEKIRDIVISKDTNKIIHANERKLNSKEKSELASRDALPLHSDTMPDGALKLEQKARLANSKAIIPQKDNFADYEKLKAMREKIQDKFNIVPIKEFGRNYAEFYHDGIGAVNKLLAERQGQVAGAFHKEGLGDIDLVWGNEQIGLNKILAKHESDFKEFGGVGAGLEKIIKDGELVDNTGVKTIILKNGDKTYRLGLSKGWLGKGKNDWIITAYKVDRSQGSDFLPSSQVAKSDGTNLHSNDHASIIPQKGADEFIKAVSNGKSSAQEVKRIMPKLLSARI